MTGANEITRPARRRTARRRSATNARTMAIANSAARSAREAVAEGVAGKTGGRTSSRRWPRRLGRIVSGRAISVNAPYGPASPGTTRALTTRYRATTAAIPASGSAARKRRLGPAGAEDAARMRKSRGSVTAISFEKTATAAASAARAEKPNALAALDEEPFIAARPATHARRNPLTARRSGCALVQKSASLDHGDAAKRAAPAAAAPGARPARR